MAQTILITGSNRGVGLALAKHYLGEGLTVLASCRTPEKADALNELAKEHRETLHVIRLDVRDEDSSRLAAVDVAKLTDHLDVLINNAGVGPGDRDDSLEAIDVDRSLNVFRTNSLGPLIVTRAMLPLLRAAESPRVVNITSGAGHVAGKTDHAMYIYGASKATLNFLTRALAAELKPQGIVVVAMGPGWVRTDMGGPNALISPAESASGIAANTAALTAEDAGRWFTVEGNLRESW